MDDFDYDIDYDIDDDQPDVYTFENIEHKSTPDGIPLNDIARMEVFQTPEGQEHHLYFGLQDTYEANYKVSNLSYDFKNLWNAFDHIKKGENMKAAKEFDKFWSDPLEFPAVIAHQDIPYTHKEMEKALILSDVVPLDSITAVNPPPGFVKRMSDVHADTIPIVCTNSVKDSNYLTVRDMAKDVRYRGEIQLDTTYHRRYKENTSYLGHICSQVQTEGKIMGFESNPAVGVFIDDYYTSVEEDESHNYQISFVRKGIKHRYLWKHDVDYKRVSPYVYYELFNDKHIMTEGFNDRIKSKLFVYRDVPELDELFNSRGKGKVIHHDVFINGCDSVFYDVNRIVTERHIFTGKKYKIVYGPDGPVDIVGTPYVYCTRRSMLKEMFPFVGRVYSNVYGMVNPHRADNISNDIVQIRLDRGDYFMREELPKGSVCTYYYDRVGRSTKLRYYVKNLPREHCIVRTRDKKYDQILIRLKERRKKDRFTDIGHVWWEFTDRWDILYYKDDNIIGAGNVAPMRVVPLPQMGHYMGPRNDTTALVPIDKQACITDSVRVIDVYNARRRRLVADTYFYGTLYNKRVYEEEIIVEDKDDKYGYMDIEYSPILLDAYKKDNG